MHAIGRSHRADAIWNKERKARIAASGISTCECSALDRKVVRSIDNLCHQRERNNRRIDPAPTRMILALNAPKTSRVPTVRGTIHG